MRSSPQEILELIHDPAFLKFDQWQVQKQAVIQMWANVYVYSSLPAQDIEKMKLKPTDDISAKLKELRKTYGEQMTVAVLPQGLLTIPYVKEE